MTPNSLVWRGTLINDLLVRGLLALFVSQLVRIPLSDRQWGIGPHKKATVLRFAAQLQYRSYTATGFLTWTMRWCHSKHTSGALVIARMDDLGFCTIGHDADLAGPESTIHAPAATDRHYAEHA